ncbi:MAG: hypothetical protein KF715_21710 [Candidatus Didemnitutus sp.]|nr:hypothetical protein [Candidatus Didemnitutus sp.]
MNWPLKQRPRSVLGLRFGGDQLSLCLLARSNGSAEVVTAATLPLPPDFLRLDAATGGRQLRDLLTQAGVRERACAVALPDHWLLARTCAVPALAPEDLAAFLQLEAEKGFPVDPAHLQIAISTCRVGDATFVTQLAARREQLDALAALLVAAGLKPVSFTAALPTLSGAVPTATGRVTIALAEERATFLAGAGGGVAALRSADSGDSLARELRITLEQIPAELRGTLSELDLRGDASAVTAAENTLGRSTGLTLAPRAAGRPFGEQLAESAGRQWLFRTDAALEFLPPRPSRFAAWWPKHGSRRLRLAGGIVATVLVATLGAFGWLEYRRWSLGSEWSAMKAQVDDLSAIQSLIRDYRPWYDTSFHSLSILRGVTTAFPETGSVTAKSFEIRGPSAVALSGTARDNAALLLVLDQLRKTREVQDLKVEQIRGKTPLQFTVSLRWKEAAP